MEMSTAKTVAVFAIIFGCFAILYPKVFHPMLLHIVGFGGDVGGVEPDAMSKIPPHLRKPGPGKVMPSSGDDITRHMRGGPHPGMRAAAEMKKQAAATHGGSGKGMMGVVLPMYAVGIVLYLLYTMTKVFGGKKDSKPGDPVNTNFTDVQYDSTQQRFFAKDTPDEDENLGNVKKGRRDLERLLLKADKNSISEVEMHDLKRRLLETESQMTRILQAMESAQHARPREAEYPDQQGETDPEDDEDSQDYEDEPYVPPKQTQKSKVKRRRVSPTESSPEAPDPRNESKSYARAAPIPRRMRSEEIKKVSRKRRAPVAERERPPLVEDLGTEEDMAQHAHAQPELGVDDIMTEVQEPEESEMTASGGVTRIGDLAPESEEDDDDDSGDDVDVDICGDSADDYDSDVDICGDSADDDDSDVDAGDGCVETIPASPCREESAAESSARLRKRVTASADCS